VEPCKIKNYLLTKFGCSACAWHFDFAFYFFAENRKKRMLVCLNEAAIDRFPKTNFGLKEVFERRVLVSLLLGVSVVGLVLRVALIEDYNFDAYL
jgi:hypothetical protein